MKNKTQSYIGLILFSNVGTDNQYSYKIMRSIDRRSSFWKFTERDDSSFGWLGMEI